MFCQNSSHTSSRGFTLVEMIVVIALSSIVMLAITGSIASFYRMNAYTIAQAYQVNFARQGMEQLVRDIREMTFADNGAYPLVIKEPYRIGFYSDIDRDSSVEYVEYILSTTTTELEKRIYSATGTPVTYYTTGTPESISYLSEYVQNILQNAPMFLYYDANGAQVAATSTVTSVEYVRAQIIVNIDPIRDPGEYMLKSSAALRNLRN